MFLESLIESGRTRQPRRGWATLVSFGIQVACIAVLVLVPLLYTGALPTLHIAEPMPPPPSAPRPDATERGHVELVPVPTELAADGRIHEPGRIPDRIFMPQKPEVMPGFGDSAAPCTICVPGGVGTPDGVQNAVLTHLLTPTEPLVPRAPLPTHPTRVSTGVVEGLLIHRVEPKYPPLAVSTRVQGRVVLQAMIGRDGKVEQLEALQGHPWLVKAALDAVRQWRYRPYLLNGVPVEVEAQIYVNFKLSE